MWRRVGCPGFPPLVPIDMAAPLVSGGSEGAPVPAAADLGSLFLQSAAATPENEACRVGAVSLTYGDLRDRALQLGAVLVDAEPRVAESGEESDRRPVLLAVSRSLSGYVGVLASVLAGRGYVPLSPAWPTERIREVMAMTRSRTLVVDAQFLDRWPQYLEGLEGPWTVVIPEIDRPAAVSGSASGHRVFWRDDVVGVPPLSGSRARSGDVAFTLFTSGSTGQPKGVCVSHAAALATQAAMSQRYPIVPGDRLAQTADFTWDPSVVDMFMAWGAGAVVACASARQALVPDGFLRDYGATVAHVVPATLRQLERAGRLKPGSLTTLRLVFVGGESFPAGLARTLSLAAPNALIVNIYGAQEYSIISTFDISADFLADWPTDQPLPLGRAFPGSQIRILGGEGETDGELVVAGPQLFSGYLGDEPMTRRVRVLVPEAPGVGFYRTGDAASCDGGGRLLCGGRLDSQVKIAGVRVELGEVEAVLRRAAGSDSVVVVPWRAAGSDAPRLAGFITGAVRSEERIFASLRAALPGYCVPARLVFLESWPRNANGKWDRLALVRYLESGAEPVPCHLHET